MGIKFGREYEDIIVDLVKGLDRVDGIYDFFEMAQTDWEELPEEERQECLRTLADDIFYGLGSEPLLQVADAKVRYLKDKHLIQIDHEDQVVTIVRLISA
ncbi:hypothetical protein [Paenibacillus lutrae]|uniref:Uncharacterized protein n=1 Tax=Paenibacillus lutrae TaxID=2078573 RepID=A0A7X3FMN2_9BACL|nr:hypothetical protein [Paenibacillus lutrae]MVP02546.1 hypothetical protein [Paenibacillus lutrae]